MLWMLVWNNYNKDNVTNLEDKPGGMPRVKADDQGQQRHLECLGVTRESQKCEAGEVAVQIPEG